MKVCAFQALRLSHPPPFGSGSPTREEARAEFRTYILFHLYCIFYYRIIVVVKYQNNSMSNMELSLLHMTFITSLHQVNSILTFHI